MGLKSYTYDANGNMESGDGREITWDAENRPASITKDQITTYFTYDGDGNRVKKTAGGVVTTIYANRYYEKTGDNVTTSYYLGSRLIAVKTGAELSYILQDHLGSTSGTTDSGGTLTSTISYFSFGSVRSSTGVSPTDKKFTGQRLDNTGLYYYNARYYDPAIGRFISADTIVPNPANPQSLNRYSYCLNNPLKYIDPSGFAPEDSLGGIGYYLSLCEENGVDPNAGLAIVLGDDGNVVETINRSTFLAWNNKTSDPYDYYRRFDNSIWLVAASGSAVLVVDDATGVGIVDDVLIPLIWAGSAAIWIGKNRDAIIEKVNDIWDSLSVMFTKQDKPLTNGEIKDLKDAGVDIHGLKGGKNASEKDLYKDPNGNVVVKPKGGNGPGEPTGININDPETWR